VDRAAGLQSSLCRLSRGPSDRGSSGSAGIAKRLRKNGRRLEITNLLRLPRAFLDRDDDDRLHGWCTTPMSEYAAAGIEAARKPPTRSLQGTSGVRPAKRNFGFETYYPAAW